MSHLLTIESPKGPIEQQWNQGQCQFGGYPTPRITQRITPGPPLLEQHPPVFPVRILFLRPPPPPPTDFFHYVRIQPFLLRF